MCIISLQEWPTFLVNRDSYENQTWRYEEASLVLATVNVWSGKKRPDLRC